MGRIKFAIWGYGNLGKALEKEALNLAGQFELVAIFSHRKISSPYNTPCFLCDEIENCDVKFDIIAVCSGSGDNATGDSEMLAKRFNVINSFDNHKQIAKHYQTMSQICKTSNTTAFISCGWDPGLFSIIRAMFSTISNNEVKTFWGMGISMGHTQVVKSISGVKDAVSLTLPNYRNLKNDNCFSHIRKIFISKNKNAKKADIIKKIKEKKEYFSSCILKIKFISQAKLQKLKNKHMGHKGFITTKCTQNNNNFSLSFSLDLSSNASFTAKILLLFMRAEYEAINQKDFKCYLPTQILSDGFLDNDINYLI